MMHLSTIAIPTDPVWWWALGLILVVLMVLTLPFKAKWCEHNLEIFFLVMGVLAVSISRQWSVELVIDALKAPVMIGPLPIGIFQAVLIFGLLIHFFHKPFFKSVQATADKLSLPVFIFILVLFLGLVSSVVSVIVTSVILAEIAAALHLRRTDRIRLIVVACFSLGLGAVLTPMGEPLSTILVQRLSGAPYNAGFTWPIQHFSLYIIPGCLALGIFGAVWIGRKSGSTAQTPSDFSDIAPHHYNETLKSVFVRAIKVFVFVAALVLLGEGLKPLIQWFLMKVPALALFWINISSAILDNATLTAIEINGQMLLPQIKAIVLGLLVAGGMLIPGNIPNIVASARLKINMREWAVVGLPIGLAIMVVYFLILLATGHM
jgi:predicted cation transporter